MAAGLWERQAELDTLGAALDDAAAGRGAVVLASGPAGIGKTSLVRTFLRGASGRARILLGACEELVASRTLGPLRDAVAGASGPLATALAGGDRDDVLAAALSELAVPGPPTVLVVEDLHWADDATLDVVRYVGRRIADLSALVLVTYRDDDTARERLSGVLGGLTADSARRLPIEPLSRDAVARWAGGTTATTAALYTLTGGNPFFVSEVLASPADGIPATVVDAVRARSSSLGDAGRAALNQLAVVPSRVELPLARALLGDLSVLADAERRGLIEVGPDSVRFRHELARRAVEETLPQTTRIELHTRVLAALTAGGSPDPARIVHHAVAAGDDAAVVAHAADAARVAARAGAQTQAAELYRQAWLRRHLLVDEALVCEEYSWSLFHARRYDDAVRTGEEAVRLHEAGADRAALGRALASLSVHQWSDLQPEAALVSARRAVDLLEDTGDSAQRVFALSYLGALLTNIDRERDALPVLDAALAMAARIGTIGSQPVARIFRGRARLLLGDGSGLDEVADGLGEARRTGDHESAVLGFLNLAASLWQAGRLDDMQACLDEGTAYGRDRDFPSYERICEAYRFRLLTVRGRWADADDGLRDLLGPGSDGGLLDWFALPYLAGLAVRRGDDDAPSLLARSRELADRAPSVIMMAPVLVAELEHAWLTGAPGPRAEAETFLRTSPHGGRERDLAELARWLRRAGGPDQDLPAGAGPPDRWPDEVAAGLRGDWRAAAAAWGRVGAPYEQALELAEGDVDAALEALRMLQDLGAGPAAARVRRRLQELGVRPPRGPQDATRENPAGLTPRQVDILRLLAAGRTNAEIAAELVLSVRTVDHHVSAVLGKLGVATRREAAREAARLAIG